MTDMLIWICVAAVVVLLSGAVWRIQLHRRALQRREQRRERNRVNTAEWDRLLDEQQLRSGR